jgi:hypothetical protein
MHSVRSSEPHEVMHWRWNKFSPGWHRHVRVGVRYDGVPARIDDLAVHARIMSSFLLQNFEGTPFSEMAVTAARNRRGQNDPSILQQVSSLLL